MKIRKFIALLCALIFAFALCACGDKTPNGDDGKKENTEPFELCFDHGFSKQVQTDTKSTGKTSYTMYMAKNEIENCQILLIARESDKTVTVEVTDFTDGKGNTLAAATYIAEYFDAAYKKIPDAMVPYNGGTFTVNKGNSQILFVEAETTADSVAGDYKATVTVKEGEEVVKSGEVKLHIWNITLSDESANTVVMDMSREAIATRSGKDLYENYYNYMLRNRVSCYNLPYDMNSKEAEQYLANPRVRGFKTTDINAVKTLTAKNAEWGAKAFFYSVDEPGGHPNSSEKEDMDIIRDFGNSIYESGLKNKYVSPFFISGYVGSMDYLTYMRNGGKGINCWVPKTAMYTTDEEYLEHEGAWNPFPYADGTFYERMQQYKSEGDSLWWYTCWDPTAPYITLNIEEKGVNPRIMFWQQKYLDIDGYLYFLVTEWDGDSWNSHEKLNSEGNQVWGDGSLIYCGAQKGLDIPVSSFRLNAVRDGVEDFEYFTMLEKLGEGKAVKDLISEITTGVVEYKSDAELFASLRINLGNMLESKLSA